MAQKCVLIITDGIGYKPDSPFNAFSEAKKPTYDWLFKNVPYSLIKTYGESVGLPENQMGNSEVGHMSIGSGRVLYQDLVKIDKAIESKELENNPLLKDLASKANDIHLLGLMSDGGVHSHLNHFLELARIYDKLNKKVWLHLITDGRDVLPTSAVKYLDSVLNEIKNLKNVNLATICGRFYAMDRDKRWDRIQTAYELYANAKAESYLDSNSALNYLENSYKNGINDEFIKPAVFKGFNGFNENDGLIMSNFRSDRAREIISALGDKDFKEFKRDKFFKYVITMCEYDETFNYPILFKKDKPKNTLGEILSQNSKTQSHIAETEKYAHVTFFFNGGLETPYPLESRILIPSPKVATYDLKPEMSAPEVGSAVREAMKKGEDFIVVNFANGDMVGHTGNLEAAIKAVQAVDKELGDIFKLAEKLDYAVVLTSDHGNCEEMKNEKGEILTNHTIGEVWCFIRANGVDSVKSGALNNIAPSVLKIMGLDIPKEMDDALF